MENYTRFYTDYKGKLLGYLMRLTGDYELSRDVLQESFLRCFEHYRQNDQQPAILFRIARNFLMDHFRKAKRGQGFQDADVQEHSGGESRVLLREECRLVAAAMRRLKDDEQEILSLVVDGGLSYKQIAEILGISEANVKVRVHRTRLRLREAMKNET